MKPTPRRSAHSATLRADRITKRFGGRTILSKVSLTLGPRTRMGVVGPNGVGKSTLLRILAGLDDPDGGRVVRVPPTATAGYLPQEPDPRAGETLLEYFARRTGVGAAETEMERLRRALADDVSMVDAYTESLERFLSLGGDDLEPRAEGVCVEVGMDPTRLDDAMGALSGGQAARAALATILLARFDVFLLDEPTNNLDFEGLAVLERFLHGLQGGVALVSHDRDFLDRSVSRIVELREETHEARAYAGGWSEYVRARDLAEGERRAAYQRYVDERDALRARTRTVRTDAASGAARARRRPTDPDKSIRHAKIEGAENRASKARIIERRLERLEAVDKPWEPWELRLQIRPRRRSGDVVARLEGAVVERGAFRLGPLDLELGWGERLAVAGPNGSGKTTLLGALLGTVPLAAGMRHLGPGTVVGEMDQHRGRFSSDRPLLDAFAEASGLLPEEARSLVAKFGLGADHVMRACASLSPGERSRAQLADLMATGVNCLVLDEPTNHLDLPAIEELERALGAFDGTLVVVSHDRRFLGSLAVTRSLELPLPG